MNKKQYEEKRNSLMNEAQALLDQGQVEEAQEKMDEVRDLDEKWDGIAQAQADFNALNTEPKPVNVFGQEGNVVNFGNLPAEENIYDSTEYRMAFMNYVLKGTPIPEKFKNENANTKTTEIGSVISPTVVNRIVEKMETIGMILLS